MDDDDIKGQDTMKFVERERTNIACVFWRLEILFQILARVVCKYCRTQAPLYTLRLYFFNKINGFINKIWSLSELNYRKNYIFSS